MWLRLSKQITRQNDNSGATRLAQQPSKHFPCLNLLFRCAYRYGLLVARQRTRETLPSKRASGSEHRCNLLDCRTAAPSCTTTSTSIGSIKSSGSEADVDAACLGLASCSATQCSESGVTKQLLPLCSALSCRFSASANPCREPQATSPFLRSMLDVRVLLTIMNIQS